MNTNKLYQDDRYIKEWNATIVDIKENGIYLDSTAFFPEGGGQSCDRGTISMEIGKNKKKQVFKTLHVVDVQEDGENVVHYLDSSDVRDGEFPFGLKVGDQVHCQLDWDRRFDNMQRHCGEHILSGIFYQECGGVNRGFHMGDSYMTIDISLEDEPTNPERSKPGEISWDLAMHCELLANKVIWSDADVYVFRYEDRAEAEKMPLRKALAFDEDISIVCVGSPENAADCVACCGTHPTTAGQVGLIKIYKVEKYKSMFRIYFEAGERALRDYDQKHLMLTDLSNKYSCSVEDFPSKIRAIEDKLATVKGELYQLKRVLAESECHKLDEAIDSALEAGQAMVIYSLEHMSMDDAFNMAKNYMGKESCKGRLILLYSVPDTSYILVSDGTIKCGALVKEYASFYQGKGGGNDTSARAIFSSGENAQLFADLIGKHLL
ncbi:MAG: alanyl-tRNA editing protein [Bacillota bacterium]|nr:alanyl-tRNA editing protein [Bacillota bacterium]